MPPVPVQLSMNPRDGDNRIGLCALCRHARIVMSLRSNVRATSYYLCEVSRVDSRFPKYPALPVRECRGFEASPWVSERPVAGGAEGGADHHDDHGPAGAGPSSASSEE